MTAINQIIEIIKQKRKDSDISNTLLRFLQVEAEKLLETEKKQKDEFAVGFSEWVLCYKKFLPMNELLEIYKKTL